MWSFSPSLPTSLSLPHSPYLTPPSAENAFSWLLSSSSQWQELHHGNRDGAPCVGCLLTMHFQALPLRPALCTPGMLIQGQWRWNSVFVSHSRLHDNSRPSWFTRDPQKNTSQLWRACIALPWNLSSDLSILFGRLMKPMSLQRIWCLWPPKVSALMYTCAHMRAETR